MTGWPQGLLQDDCRKLSKWLANRPGARRIVRENLKETMTLSMNLGTLISKLQALPADLIIPNGFGKARSWRGAYDEIAFVPEGYTRAGAMLQHALNALGATFEGYKGGTYLMSARTAVNIAEWGDYGGDDDYLSEERFDYMVEEATSKPQICNEEHKRLLLLLADAFAKEGVAVGIASQIGSDEAKTRCKKDLHTARSALQAALDLILPDGSMS